MRRARIGALAIERHADHVFLAELLIDPAHQRRGLGTEIVNQLLADAAAAGLPVRLQVLRENRAQSLYQRLGFTETGQTDTHVLMERATEPRCPECGERI